jgi:peptide-methionine (R)-S-oxide reductase
MSSEPSAESNPSSPPTRVVKSDEEWRAILTDEQYRVLRQKGTESADDNEYNSHFPTEGIYLCSGCSAPLYTVSTKFDSGSGWPAFWDSIPNAVKRNVQIHLDYKTIEIVCAKCDGHLGHVFEGEWKTKQFPTNERHCVNSVSLKYKPSETSS